RRSEISVRPCGLDESVRHASGGRKNDRERVEFVMAIKTFRPKTASLRFKTVIDYKQEITTDEPYKPLLDRKTRTDGRDNYGHLTARHRGGRNQQHYRYLDFRPHHRGTPAT